MKEVPYPKDQLFFRQEAERVLSSNPQENALPIFLTTDDLKREYAIQKIMLALQQEKINELYASTNPATQSINGATNNTQYGAAENNPLPNLTLIDKIDNNNILLSNDATAEITATEKLANQQRFIKGITDNAPCLMSYWTKDLVCTFTNQTAKEWLGTELKDIVGHNMKDVLGDELFANNYPYIKRALQGEKVQFERGGFKIHGNPGYIWIQYVPDIENGVVKGFYSLVTDITELKKTQSAIDFEAIDKEALINSSKDYMCSIDKDYNILTANTAYKSLFESVTGVPVRKGDNVKTGSGFDEATWRLWEGFFERALSGESFTIETSTTPENGQWELWTECSFTPIIQNGEITGLACYSRDITERKRADRQLKESKTQLDLILNTVTDLIYVIKVEDDMQLRLSLTNRVLPYIHPFKKEDAAGLLLKDYMPEDRYNTVKEKIFHSIETRQTVTWEQYYINDGIEKYGIQNVTPIFNEDGNCAQVIGSMYDITERKTAEKTIIESYKKLEDYKFALDQSSMVFILDANGVVQYVNENFCRLSKYSPEELIGSRLSMLNSGHHPEYFFEDLWQTVRSGKVWRGQIKNKAKDGEYYWINATVTPFMDADGNPYQYLGIDTDITQTKLAKDALVLSNERFQYAMDATFDAIWDLDNITGNIFWGEGYKKLFGYEPGLSFYEPERDFYPKIHPDDLSNFLKISGEAVNSNSNHWSVVYRFLKADGQYAYVADKAVIIRNETGQPVRMIGAMQDITERTMAAAEVEKSELKFRSMVHNITDVIILVDEKGLVLYSSPSLKPVLGYTPEEINGLKLFNLLHPIDYAPVKEVFKGLLTTKGNGGIIEFKYKHKNGHYVIMEAQGNNQLDNPAINAVILTARDITRRKEKEEEKMLLVYELMEKNADLKQFSYITSHNLRAPLTNLMAICNLLDTEGLTQNDTVELISAFKISTTKLSETLNDLIKILIIKDGRSEDIDRVYFDKALADVKTSIGGLIEMSGAAIHADFARGASINFYPAYVESIFLNLLTNAIKYAHPYRKPVVAIQTVEDDKFVVLTFMDNGIGMDMKRVKSKIFGLYQRFHNKIEGKGIGLYLVHSQVTALGGTISVDSTEGEGTTFVIRFKKELFRVK